ncbi:MAG TPA: hypothetical protein EYP25_14080 [Anaerolineae bacterium]|nr:hypothetical protein [Caldilineae bacterium]HID35668.1 hypothetical protein [Anaerolineae bacterium]
MAEKLRIYVAATADLEPQRSLVAHLLARLPVQAGAELRRCPPAGASYDDLFERISNVDRVYFLMGKDITAPAGTEWDLAMQLQRPTLPLRRRSPITPSAFLFITQAILQVSLKDWRFFQSNLELAHIIAQDLIELLLHPQNRYGLTAGETLLLNQKLLDVKAGRWPQMEDLPTEVLGEGGVILDARPELDNPLNELPVFPPPHPTSSP